MKRQTIGLLLTGFAALVGCGAGEPEPAPETMQNPGLAGTSWRLVEFQSMDDTIGVQTPPEPATYTMTLGADGTATFRLNCNRGSGSYKVEPAEDRASGKLEFGPIATTTALCPEPNMDALLGKQLPYIRSYLIQDGNLYLSLMADGGIFKWEPWDGDE